MVTGALSGPWWVGGLLHLGQRCPVSERVGTLFIKGHCKLVEFTNFTTSVMAQICKELKKY